MASPRLWRAHDERNGRENGSRRKGLEPAPDPGELDRVFSTMSAARVDAVIVFPSPMLFNERTQIVALSRKLRLPLVSMGREFVVLGGLMSYGADITEFIRRGATYVDKILKGTKPADLPVEQPTKFGLSINLKTARELGIELPATLLAHADEVIE